jgi:hypothetical protein
MRRPLHVSEVTSPSGTVYSRGAAHLECFQLDPLQDPRWEDLVQRHPKASVFHTVGWLEALKSTYGYEPVAFTTSPPAAELKNGLVFCRIKSWLTGSRLVSLPFSDHCEPLCDSPEDFDFLIRYLQAALERENWRYLEVRSISRNLGQTNDSNGTPPPTTYLLHVVDLHPDLNDVFRRLDKDSVQRRIRRAEHAGLIEKSGTSEELLGEFYELFRITRGRHQLPPTPYAWFRNLIHCQGHGVEIRVAHHERKPIAAILTLRFRDVLYYKYGCSDTRFNSLGATPWLLWNAIAAAKISGATSFDMGRTQADHLGLLTFKNHWVSQPQPLVYWSFPTVSALDSVGGWRLKVAQGFFSHMPERLLEVTGRTIYRHIG